LPVAPKRVWTAHDGVDEFFLGGRDFAAEFTWQACAEATVAVYRQLAQEPGLG
jgi:hypothetical protein